MTKDAFIREVRNAETMLYHISKSILKNDADCGDAVQETLLKVYEKLPMLKEEKFFRTWITRILINECKGILRKQKKVVPYEDYMDNERLSEESRYHHLYMAIMELPEGTIKSRLSRARDFLKVQLSDEEEKSPISRKNSKTSNKVTGKGKMPC